MMMNKPFNILAIETSCDDTSVAIINSDYKVLANINDAQLIHNLYGGVVPEIASRIHMKHIMKLTKSSLNKALINLTNIDAIAVSVNPGLIGSLLVGVSYAKALSYSLNIPLIAVNHLMGHIYANKITSPDLSAPFLALVVSGGHTELIHFKDEQTFTLIGNTCDDAAGEAFDKIAKILRLEYPGGPIIDKLSKKGDLSFHYFPRAFNQQNNYNFSYSGLKTAFSSYIHSQSPEFIKKNIHHLAASAQVAIIEPLVKKTVNYAKSKNIKKIVLAGGVSANSLLRKQIFQKAEKLDIKVFAPPIEYCMDNASMIGAAAIVKYKNNNFSSLDLNPFSTKGTREV